MSQLKLSFLGSPQIVLDGKLVTLSRRKSMALLAYLAVTAVPHNREFLATLLWPNFDQSRTLAYLRRALWDVNQALGVGRLHIDREQVGLPPSPSNWLDVVEFETLAQARNRNDLTTAAALYRGDFLEGFTLRDSLAFDDWQVAQREQRRRQLEGCLQKLIRLLAEEGDLETAVVTSHKWLALDNLNETAHRQLMRLYMQLGQRAAALQQYETCAQTLAAELGIQPEPATVKLHQAIKKGELLPQTAPVLAGFAPAQPEINMVCRLPVQLTPFIGRAKEQAIVSSLLNDPTTRLVTLIGPGGIGKTRLAIEVAAANRMQFPDGVYFVALSALTQAKSIPFAIAEALHLNIPTGADVTAVLLDWLASRKTLLLLDNFEHVLPGAALVQTLLVGAPTMTLLVTSRERLALQAERLVDVFPLDYPAPDDRDAAIEQFDAAALFASRASYLRHDFDLGDGQTQADVARICQLVEGHPLALEMAASWIRSRPLAAIVAEIAENLGQLQSSMVDVAWRHQSLQAVFDFSWGLLSSDEQVVLLQLALFRGGFSTEAAAFVTGCSHSTLASLLEKSFIRLTENGRYTLHNVYQEFALEKLQQRPQLAWTAQLRHWTYFADFLAAQESALKGAYLKDAFAQIHQEFPNIRYAWEWALAHKQFADMEKTVTSLWFYYGEHHSEEGRQLLQHTAEVLSTEKSDDVKLLYWKIMAVEIYLIGAFNRKQILLDIAPPILAYVKNHPVTDWDMLIAIVVGSAKMHDIISRDEAEELEAIFLTRARKDGDYYWISRLLQSLAWCELFLYEPGDMEKAEKYSLESLEVARQHDIAMMQNTASWQMAHVGLIKKEYAKAYEYGRFAWAGCMQSGELGFVLACFIICIRICLAWGNMAEARICVSEALSHPRSQQGEWPQIILAYYVRLLYQEDKRMDAVEYASLYLHSTPPEEVDCYLKEMLIELENELPSEVFQAAERRGRLKGLRDLQIELALEKAE